MTNPSIKISLKDELVHLECQDRQHLKSELSNFGMNPSEDTRFADEKLIFSHAEIDGFGSFLRSRCVSYVVFRGNSDEPIDFWSPSMEESSTGLESISGVGSSEADLLRQNGILTIEDVRIASQSDLADIDRFGNALAARIKADVGGD